MNQCNDRYCPCSCVILMNVHGIDEPLKGSFLCHIGLEIFSCRSYPNSKKKLEQCLVSTVGDGKFSVVSPVVLRRSDVRCVDEH